MEKHINDLLYLYDCVIIPALGGFVANNKSAELNEKTGVFSPPRKEIGFNKSLSHNDGLLINHIATKEGISYEACNTKITKHVNVLKYQLSQGETISFGIVGDLKNDAIGNIVFIPNQEESFSTNSFGLSTFHFNTLEQIKDQNEPTRQLVRRTLRAKSTRQIAASVSLIIGLLFVSPEINDVNQQSNFSDFLPKVSNTEVNETIAEEEAPAYKVAKEEIKPIEIIEETIEPAIVKNSYFIIAGSFKQMKPAEQFLKKLHNKGIEQAEILEANNRFRVSLQGFTNRELAVEALSSFRKENGLSSSWLFTKR
ncbi:HU domain-containing protein [Labilibacter marinus]|uniref:HU domain-containing protein n=1 Tax=Labilibacter marinus TaxID=1477105 RepID=UPI00094F706A|nr:SPOR domain-containing protein [Labilibacter marinus]